MNDEFENREVSGLVSAGLLFFFSVTALVLALAFEHYWEHKPCPLCLMERFAYYAVIPVSMIALIALKVDMRGLARLLLALCGLAFFANAALGGYHAGIEWKWWPGPTDCTGDMAISGSSASLLDSLSNIQLIRCDVATFRLFGISFAGANFLLSLLLGAIGLWGAIKVR